MTTIFVFSRQEKEILQVQSYRLIVENNQNPGKAGLNHSLPADYNTQKPGQLLQDWNFPLVGNMFLHVPPHQCWDQ